MFLFRHRHTIFTRFSSSVACKSTLLLLHKSHLTVQLHTRRAPTPAVSSAQHTSAPPSYSPVGSFLSGIVLLSGHHVPADDPKYSKISNVLSFFPIKDASGTTQLVVRRNPLLASLSDVPVESAVLIQGRVSERPPKDRRPVSLPSLPSFSLSPSPSQSPTGNIEVHVDDFTVLNPASQTLPFYPSDEKTLVRLSFPSLGSDPTPSTGQR